MDKSPEAFRTISEVAEALDVPPHVLRFWETRFAQVKPVKRGGGRRYYRPEDVRLLRGIRGLLYDDGMTIKGVQKILRERGIRHVIGLGTVPEPEPRPAPAPAPGREPRRAAAAAAGARGRRRRRRRSPTSSSRRRRRRDRAVAAAARAAGRSAAAQAARQARAARALLAELQALRAVMIDDDRRRR